MKFVLSAEDVLKIVSDHLQNQFQSGCKFECSNDYKISGDTEWHEMTQDYLDKKERDRIEMEKIRARWAAEDEAKKEAAKAVTEAAK